MKSAKHILQAVTAASLVAFSSCQSSGPAATPKPETEKKINAYWTELTEIPATLPARPTPLPEAYRLLKLNLPVLRAELAAEGKKEGTTTQIAVPMPNHSLATFTVSEAVNNGHNQTARRPASRSFTGNGTSDATTGIRMEISANSGFSATIKQPNSMTVIEPYIKGDTVHYISYYKSRRGISHPNLRNMQNTKPAEKPAPRK